MQSKQATICTAVGWGRKWLTEIWQRILTTIRAHSSKGGEINRIWSLSVTEGTWNNAMNNWGKHEPFWGYKVSPTQPTTWWIKYVFRWIILWEKWTAQMMKWSGYLQPVSTQRYSPAQLHRWFALSLTQNASDTLKRKYSVSFKAHSQAKEDDEH